MENNDKDIKSKTLSCVEDDGKALTKERDMLETLNCDFVSVGPKLTKSIETRHLQHILIKCSSKQSIKSMCYQSA